MSGIGVWKEKEKEGGQAGELEVEGGKEGIAINTTKGGGRRSRSGEEGGREGQRTVDEGGWYRGLEGTKGGMKGGRVRRLEVMEEETNGGQGIEERRVGGRDRERRREGILCAEAFNSYRATDMIICTALPCTVHIITACT